MKKVLVIILLIVVAGLAGWFYLRSKPAGPTPAPKTEVQTSAEQEFLDSGQAKAIERETDLWQFYDNPEVGISFNYPQGTTLGEEVRIDLEDMGQEAGPMRLSAEDEMETVMALSSGEFGKNADFVFEPSQEAITVGFLFAQDFLVLSRFEVCSVVLEKKLSFYFNNKHITLTSVFPEGKLKELMPEYFTTDGVNCPGQEIWDFEKQEEFYQTLEAGQAPEEVQEWYDNFGKMSETVIFAHR